MQWFKCSNDAGGNKGLKMIGRIKNGKAIRKMTQLNSKNSTTFGWALVCAGKMSISNAAQFRFKQTITSLNKSMPCKGCQTHNCCMQFFQGTTNETDSCIPIVLPYHQCSEFLTNSPKSMRMQVVQMDNPLDYSCRFKWYMSRAERCTADSNRLHFCSAQNNSFHHIV